MATFGETNTGNAWSTLFENGKRGTKQTLSVAGTVTKLSWYLDGQGAGSDTSQGIKAFIYADSAGSPGALCGAASGQVNVLDGASAGWVDFTFASPIHLAAGDYWLCTATTSTSQIIRAAYYNNSGALFVTSGIVYADEPTDPCGSPGSTQAYHYCAYATYVPDITLVGAITTPAAHIAGEANAVVLSMAGTVRTAAARVDGAVSVSNLVGFGAMPGFWRGVVLPSPVSGAVQAGPATIVGSVNITQPLAGAIQTAAARISGSVSITQDASGAVQAAAVRIAGAISVTQSVDGAVTTAAARVSGEMVVTVTLEGTLTAAAARISGSLAVVIGFPGNIGSGKVSMQSISGDVRHSAVAGDAICSTIQGRATLQ